MSEVLSIAIFFSISSSNYFFSHIFFWPIFFHSNLQIFKEIRTKFQMIDIIRLIIRNCVWDKFSCNSVVSKKNYSICFCFFFFFCFKLIRMRRYKLREITGTIYCILLVICLSWPHSICRSLYLRYDLSN